ncbi:MAG: DUF4351 domain-containing protein [Magnetococcales bacterium]|nr:DUF4351 domain-containing protein [Magnetococcales bacterium]
MSDTPSKTCWHCLIGATLKELLEPVGIEVRTEVPVVSLPPKADLVLLQRKAGRTEEQRLRMADGLWDLDVEQILAEIKVTESLNERSFAKAYRYDDSYLESAKLQPCQLRTVMISSITPHQSLLARCSFQPVGLNGVYENPPIFGRILRLIVLNQLADQPHNAPLKCFASRMDERRRAFKTLEQDEWVRVSKSFNAVLAGLRSNLMQNSLSHLDNAGLTPDSVMRIGRRMLEATLDMMDDDELYAIPKLGHFLSRKLQDGAKQGEQFGEAKILTRQLQRRFGTLPDWASERITKADSSSLEEWGVRVLDAHSLEEVFREP